LARQHLGHGHDRHRFGRSRNGPAPITWA
jgi:hypothetical protein